MKKRSIIMISLVLALILIYSKQRGFLLTRTTDLDREAMDGIRIKDSIDSSFFTENFSAYIDPECNDMFYFKDANIRSYGLSFDKDKGAQMTIGFNELSNEILYLSKYKELPKKSLGNNIGNRGLVLGDRLEKVIEVYGKNYYTYGSKEDGPRGIGYIDRKNKLKLLFLHDDQNIVYFYSLEDLGN